MSTTLKFEDGSVQFRQRIAVSLLSHRNLLIRNIRNDDIEGGSIGLQNHEASFLRLIDKLTNGSIIEINNTGTQLRFKPGVIIGNTITHECPKERSVSWFLEGILPLLPFGKEAADITLTGITEGLCEQDASVDYWKANLPNVLERFGISSSKKNDPHTDFMDDANTYSMQILNRSSDSNGRIRIQVPIVRSSLSPINWTDAGKIKRIRGTILSSHASTMARVAYATKGILQQLIPDVWIHTERIPKSTHTTNSRRLTVVLTAESTDANVYTTETAAAPRSLAEDVGQETLYQPFLVGCPDSCTGYRVDDDLNDTDDPMYYRLTLEWYLGQAKLDLHPPLPEFGKFYDMGYNYQCPIEFVDALGRASDTLEESLRRHHDANHINITAQKRMHMSLAYLCCLRLEEAYHVREIMEAFVHDTTSFHIPDVTFERIECWKERFNSITHIIVVDHQSQQRLLNLLKQLEDRILEAGIPVPISRLTQMPFHSTLLGVFIGEKYSLDPQHNIDPILPVSFAALREINLNLWTGFTFDIGHRPKYSWRPMLQAAIE